MSELSELIKSRKSVRSYDGRPISSEDRAKLEAYTKTVANPFDIPVEFLFLDAAKHGLSSPVVSGASLFLAGKVAKKGNKASKQGKK